MAEEPEIEEVFMDILGKRQKIKNLTDGLLLELFFHVHRLVKINLEKTIRGSILAGLVHGWLEIRFELAKREQSDLIKKSREGIVKCKLDYSELRLVPEAVLAVNNFLIRFGKTHEGDLVRRLIKAPHPRISPKKRRRGQPPKPPNTKRPRRLP